MAETREPETVKQARELNYEDRAEYWEGEARHNSAQADRCRASGERQAARVFDEYAASARSRSYSERREWIAIVLSRSTTAIQGGDPGLAAELAGVAAWLRANL